MPSAVPAEIAVSAVVDVHRTAVEGTATAMFSRRRSVVADPVTTRFDGEICGFGTESGVRIVAGVWETSPFGRFADVMVEQADGHRILLAPSDDVATFVGGIYSFDEVRIVDVCAERSPTALRVIAGPLSAIVGTGRRDAIGWALHAVPTRLAGARRWTVVTDPVARTLLRGVRTRGRTPGGREYYAAYDRHRLVMVEASWRGTDLGALRPVLPPVRFGFGSTPSTPSIVRLSTIVEADP